MKRTLGLTPDFVLTMLDAFDRTALADNKGVQVSPFLEYVVVVPRVSFSSSDELLLMFSGSMHPSSLESLPLPFCGGASSGCLMSSSDSALSESSSRICWASVRVIWGAQTFHHHTFNHPTLNPDRIGLRLRDETLYHVRVRVRVRFRIRGTDSSSFAISSCYKVYVIKCLVIKCRVMKCR